MAEAATINAFILGLPSSIRGTVAALNPQTFTAAYSAVCNLKGSLPSKPTSSDVAAAVRHDESAMHVAALGAKVDTLISKVNNMEVAKTPLPTGGSNIPCQLCGKNNHQALSCFMFTQLQRQIAAPIQAPPGNKGYNGYQNNPKRGGNKQNKRNMSCHYCHRKGHFQNECRTKMNDMQSQSQQYNPFVSQYQSGAYPHQGNTNPFMHQPQQGVSSHQVNSQGNGQFHS